MTNYEYENRISDDEIISSLEVIATTRNCSECKIRNCNWGDCNCSQITANAALDLINRQKAEIEELKIENKSLRSAANCYKLHYNEVRTEAYKEFAERLKNEIINDTAYACDSTQHSGYYDYQIKVGDIPEYIDNLVKEMEGDSNE